MINENDCECPFNIPVCDHFSDDDQGLCMNCGHRKACHEEDLK